MPKEKKIEFHENVDRSETKSKVTDLLNITADFIEICKHEFWIKNSKNKLLRFLANYIKLFKDISFFFALIMNFFIFVSFGDDFGDRLSTYTLF